MYGTCAGHADIHSFNDECVGWRDAPFIAEHFVIVVVK